MSGTATGTDVRTAVLQVIDRLILRQVDRTAAMWAINHLIAPSPAQNVTANLQAMLLGNLSREACADRILGIKEN